MTITEKILARASDRQRVSPGDVIFAKVDKLMMHDVSGPGVIKVFDEWDKKGRKFDKEKKRWGWKIFVPLLPTETHQ